MEASRGLGNPAVLFHRRKSLFYYETLPAPHTDAPVYTVYTRHVTQVTFSLLWLVSFLLVIAPLPFFVSFVTMLVALHKEVYIYLLLGNSILAVLNLT